jgi:hypothetical protein
MAIEQNPFGVEKVDEAQTLIERADAEQVQANFSFYYGDHWQDGTAWSGPIPATTDAEYAEVSEQIRTGLASKNVVKELTDRAANAVTGRNPIWDVVPNRVVDDSSPITPEEQSLMDEAKLLLNNWIEQKELQKYMSKTVRQMLLAGKSTLRLFIPSGFVVNGVAQVDTTKPLDVLEIDAPNPLDSAVVVDPNSREKMAVFLGDVGTPSKPKPIAEIAFLLPVATVNGRVTEIDIVIDKEGVSTVQLDLGGRLPIYQMEMPRLITEQIVSMQKALNLNLTMMQRNSVLGGFLERVILNGQLPGHIDEDTGEFVYDEYIVGAGSVTSLTGIPITDATTGNVTQYTPTSINYRDPVSPDTFLKASDNFYRMMLETSDQLHALISGDAAASGESRRQAVASFFSYLRTPKQEVDKAGRWILETALAYAGYLTGNAGKYGAFKVVYDSKLDSGAIPTAEIDLVERLVQVGIMSLETAREKIGIEDPELEARRVQDESGTLNQVSKVNPDGTSKITGQTLQNVNNNDITG